MKHMTPQVDQHVTHVYNALRTFLVISEFDYTVYNEYLTQ